jgi:hypothetical protein
VSDKINDGGPAFPVFTVDAWKNPWVSGGMTLRDWFAGQVLACLVVNPNTRGIDGLASDSYRYADAMLKARQH